MSADTTAVAKLEIHNHLMREALTWIVKNSLDYAARARAKETLRQIDPSAAASLDADRRDLDFFGEWCI
jgi:hypothetical protein